MRLGVVVCALFLAAVTVFGQCNCSLNGTLWQSTTPQVRTTIAVRQ